MLNGRITHRDKEHYGPMDLQDKEMKLKQIQKRKIDGRNKDRTW